MMSLEEMRSQIVSGSRSKYFQDFYHRRGKLNSDRRGKLNSEHAYAPSLAESNDKAISATASPFALLLT